MKKMFSIFVSIVCSVLFIVNPISSIISVKAEGDGTMYINKDDVTEHNIKVISNVAGDTSMILYEYQSHFYITMEKVKQLTGLTTSVSISGGIFSATVTDGLRTVHVNLEDRTITDEINDKIVKNSYGKEIINDINTMLFNNDFLVEAVPFLRYLGAEVAYIDGYFVCLMNKNSIWSILPDAIEEVDKFIIPFTSYIPDYKKRLTLDIIGDFLSDWNFNRSMDDYYKEAIYDIFEVNPFSYNSVKKQEECNIQEENTFFDSKQLLDLGDQFNNVSIDSTKAIEDLILTQKIDWLNLKWNGAYKMGFWEETAKISQELNQKTVMLYEDTINGGKIDKAGYAISALIYGAKIVNDYCKIYNYDSDLALCLATETNNMRYIYSDSSSIGWLSTADQISGDVLNNWNNIRDSFIDNTIDLIRGEGTDLMIMAVSEKALLPMKAATFITNIICKDIIESEHREILTMLQEEMQLQCYQLFYDLWKKAKSENFSNVDTMIRLTDALKFYYLFSMAYNNSIQKWGEYCYPENDWNTPLKTCNDIIALRYYNLLNCTISPQKGLFNYKEFKDDVFTDINLSNANIRNDDDLFYNYLSSVLIPKYGLYNTECDVETKTYSNGYILTNAASQMSNGIVGVDVTDFNNDGNNEMFVATVLPLKSDSEEGRKVTLQLYSLDETKTVHLTDEQDLLHIMDFGLIEIFNKISIIEAPDGCRYISLYKNCTRDGTEKQVAIIGVSKENQFELCEMFIDPGYTSGIGLYYSDTIPVHKIAITRYYDCEEVYSVNFSDEVNFDLDDYFDQIIERISPYGITVIRNEGTDFMITGNNENLLFSLTLKSNYDSGITTIHVTGKLLNGSVTS